MLILLSDVKGSFKIALDLQT